MSLFSKKTSADDQHSDNAGKNKVSLLILLILVGVFAYLYFFTNMIVPHQAAKPTPPAAPPEIKQSMPPRPTATGTTATAPGAPAATPAAPVAATAGDKKVAEGKPAPATAPAVPAAPAAKPAPAPVAPAAKPAPTPAAKPATPAPAAAKPSPTPQPQPATAKAAPPATVPAQTAKPAKAAAEPAKTVAPVKQAKKKATYTLATSELLAGEADAAEAKLKKHGVKPVLKQVSKKGKTMNRLFVNSFTDYNAYAAELEKVRKQTKAAFGIEHNGKYSVYAGSFSSTPLAQKEQKLLQGKGVTVKIQKTVLPGQTVKLTAGAFSSRAAANRAAALLAKDDLAVRVISRGK